MRMLTRAWFIYALIVPTPLANAGDVRYVGYTWDIDERMRGHRGEAYSPQTRHRPKNEWLREILSYGFHDPPHILLESGIWTGPDLRTYKTVWEAAETRWIAHFRARGADLTNATKGGQGTHGRRHTPEAKERMAAAKRGRKMSPEARAKMSAARRGRRLSARALDAMLAGCAAWRARPKDAAYFEMRGRIAEKLRGRKITPEHVAKLVASHVGRIMSPEERARRSAAQRGKKRSPEYVAKMRARLTGRKLSPEHVAKSAESHRGKKYPKMSAAARGRKHSPESIEKTRHAHLGSKRTPEQCRNISDGTRRWAATRPTPPNRAAAIAALADGPLRAKEIAVRIGITPKQAQMLCFSMMRAGIFRRVKFGTYELAQGSNAVTSMSEFPAGPPSK